MKRSECFVALKLGVNDLYLCLETSNWKFLIAMGITIALQTSNCRQLQLTVTWVLADVVLSSLKFELQFV